MWEDMFNPEPTMQQGGMENQILQQNMLDMQQMQLAQQQQMLFQQQMLNQQMGHPQMMNQQMYSPMQQNMYGMHQVRYTKSQIIQGLRDYVIMQSNRVITREEKLEDLPNILRHACVESTEKITKLGINYFNIPEIGLSVPFYFCMACGKLYYPKDFVI